MFCPGKRCPVLICSPDPAKCLSGEREREREGEENPFGLALFNPWPERGAVELWNEDKESNMFNQIFKITARKGEGYESVSEHVDREERGICEFKQSVRRQHPFVVFPGLPHLAA